MPHLSLLRLLSQVTDIRPQGNRVLSVKGEMGIPLTQVAPISSMPGWGQKSIRGM